METDYIGPLRKPMSRRSVRRRGFVDREVVNGILHEDKTHVLSPFYDMIDENKEIEVVCGIRDEEVITSVYEKKDGPLAHSYEPIFIARERVSKLFENALPPHFDIIDDDKLKINEASPRIFLLLLELILEPAHFIMRLQSSEAETFFECFDQTLGPLITLYEIYGFSGKQTLDLALSIYLTPRRGEGLEDSHVLTISAEEKFRILAIFDNVLLKVSRNALLTSIRLDLQYINFTPELQEIVKSLSKGCILDLFVGSGQYNEPNRYVDQSYVGNTPFRPAYLKSIHAIDKKDLAFVVGIATIIAIPIGFLMSSLRR